jgi:hypothetical protein
MNTPAVDAYLDQVAAGLHGPRRQRKRILAELRDGLGEAIAGRRAGGMASDQAATAAVASFGDPGQVAHAFAGELATGSARRTVIGYVATGPLVGIWWLLLLHADPWRTGLAAFLAAVPVLPVVAVGVATAAGVVATTGRMIRWLPEASPRRALEATVGVAAFAAAGDVFMIAFLVRSGAHADSLTVVAVAASLLRIGCSAAVIRRCHMFSVPGWPGSGRPPGPRSGYGSRRGWGVRLRCPCRPGRRASSPRIACRGRRGRRRRSPW